ncbi:MAG TPA: ABC transporter ATP-binding protein [Acidobacteriota bacterium]|nr:ABC transporter ATP-binding protein [Acidobacteriota bacterium]
MNAVASNLARNYVTNRSPLVEVQNLGKKFRYYSNRWERLRGSLLPAANHSQGLWALRNISFSLPPGTTLGVIGLNGSGKTTLLQIIAGLLKPTEGSVSVRGNLATLLELGTSFQPETTGRENIYVSAGLSGFSRKEIESKVEKIIAFSELQDFIDRPVKHYSTGMLMRLAFATAINVEPDVLLIDEVFAVGDMAFQHKCTRKLRELQNLGATIILVTHDLLAIKSLCNQALLLNHGKCAAFGNPEDVTNQFLSLIADKIAHQTLNGNGNGPQEHIEPAHGEFLECLIESERMHRHGSGEGKIRGIQILNSNSLPTEMVTFGEDVTFRFYIEYYQDVSGSGLGFYLRDKYGNDVAGLNTYEEKKDLGDRKKGDRLIVDFKMPLHLRPGSYSVSPGLSYHRNEPRYLDWIDNALFFQMQKPVSGREVYGFMHIPNHVTVKLLRKP